MVAKARTDIPVTASSIVIHPTVMVLFTSINEQAYNPRKITPEKFVGLKASIRKNGFLDPLVLRKTGNGLIGGHQRMRAVREICAEDKTSLPLNLPCVILDIDERDAKKLNIALNKLGGEFDNKKLAELLIDIQGTSPITASEREEMGFRAVEMTDLLTLNDPPVIDTDPKSFAKGPTLSLLFGNASTRDSVKEALKKRAEAMKKPPGDVVFDLLGGAD